jgi:acetyltransferase
LIQEAVEHFRAARIPEYRFPERAAVALSILAQRAEYLEAEDFEGFQLSPSCPETVRAILAGRSAEERADQESFLTAEQTTEILNAYGIPTARAYLAEDPESAAELANQIGFPVALKVASPDIAHKSDVSGVMLDIKTMEEVEEGFERLVKNARSARPQARIAGVYVQQMIPQGQEVIIGAIQDPQFGPLVMFGSGGVEVEGLKDVQFGLAPLNHNEAESMLAHTWAGRKLEGYRNLMAADREAVLEALQRLAQLAADFPELAEVEVNPLRVLPRGQGVVAVDIRARRTTPQQA